MSTFSSHQHLAVFLEALAGHLYTHPHLPHINHIHGANEVHINSNPSDDALVGAEGVLLWADTLIDPGIEICALESFTDVAVIGMFSSWITVKVWAADRGPIHQWASDQDFTPGTWFKTRMTLAELKTLVAQHHPAVAR